MRLAESVKSLTGLVNGRKPKIGLMDGTASICDDFDQPMEPFEQDYYGS